jgi:hypothetical protein
MNVLTKWKTISFWGNSMLLVSCEYPLHCRPKPILNHYLWLKYDHIEIGHFWKISPAPCHDISCLFFLMLQSIDFHWKIFVPVTKLTTTMSEARKRILGVQSTLTVSLLSCYYTIYLRLHERRAEWDGLLGSAWGRNVWCLVARRLIWDLAFYRRWKRRCWSSGCKAMWNCR